MYMKNMPEVCRKSGTNPEYPLTLLQSMRLEFEKGLQGDGFDPAYVLEKMDSLRRHVEWLALKAQQQSE